MRKLLLLTALAGVAVAFGVVQAVSAGNGAIVTKTCPVASCGFTFWDGNGVLTPDNYQPTSYSDVVTPSGIETEVFKGTIPNDTGHAVIYSPTSGPPIPADQTCYSFATGATTPDWQLTISASGNFSLVCHFTP